MTKAFFVLSAVFTIIAFGSPLALAEVKLPERALESGNLIRTQKTKGTDFNVSGSDYLNVSIHSSKEVSLSVLSIPKIILIEISKNEVSSAERKSDSKTKIEISNLAPDTVYYKYEDNYHNRAEFRTDKDGKYDYTQDISASHVVFIQPTRSTKFISDDATGGDCQSIGNWDNATNTCTLTTNLTETVQIDDDNIILDGDNHTLTGSDTGSGVYIYEHNGVTVKNLNISHFSFGIRTYDSNGNHIDYNTLSNNHVAISSTFSGGTTVYKNIISNNNYGISWGGDPSDNRTLNTINENTISNTHYHAISISYSDINNILDNPLTDNGFGIGLYYSSGNEVTGNSIIRAYKGIDLGVDYAPTEDNVFSDNTIQSSYNYGIFISGPGAENNTFTSNNLIDNQVQAVDISSSGNAFNSVSNVGNYWKNHNSPDESCYDTNANGICDSAYAFYYDSYTSSYKNDNYPLVEPIMIGKTLAQKAAILADQLVNQPYGYLFGGKGWNFDTSKFIPSAATLSDYKYWHPAEGNNPGYFDYGAGVDCSGLVMWAFNRANNPDLSFLNNFVKWEGANKQYSDLQSDAVDEENEDILPGDTMYFDWNNDENIDHTAIYVGSRGSYDVVSAKSGNDGIVEEVKDEYKMISGFVAFRRLHEGQVAMRMDFDSTMDIIVTDPDGFTIDSASAVEGSENNIVSGNLYFSKADKELKSIYSSVLKKGNYTITVKSSDSKYKGGHILKFNGNGKTIEQLVDKTSTGRYIINVNKEISITDEDKR